MRFSLFALAGPRRALARLAGAAAVAVALSACSFITGIPDVSRVELDSPVTAIAPGERVTLSGVALTRGGSVITHRRRRLVYRSSDDSVATVSREGVVTGVAPGRVSITAESDGKRDQVDLTVRPIPVRQIVIAPRSPIVRLAPSVVFPLGATVLDTNRQNLGTRRLPTWASLDTTVATISAVGILTPKKVGTVRVTAFVENGLAPAVELVADTIEVRVTPVPIISVTVAPVTPTLYLGQPLQFTATVVDSIRQTVTDRRVVWSSSAPSVLAIDSLTGLATPVTAANGVVAVTATVERVPGFPSDGTLVDRTNAAVLAPAASVRVTNSLGQTVTARALQTNVPDPNRLTFTALDASGGAVGGTRLFLVTSDAPAVVASESVPVPTSYQLRPGATPGTATVTVQAVDARNQPQGTPATILVTVSAP